VKGFDIDDVGSRLSVRLAGVGVVLFVVEAEPATDCFPALAKTRFVRPGWTSAPIRAPEPR